MLSWTFDGTGAWEAMSGCQSQMWRIVVCDDGTFDVSESSPDLTEHQSTFSSLESAKRFCLATETQLTVRMRPLHQNQAIFKARQLFREWNNTTGFVDTDTSYYGEILGVIDDAVECGWEAAKHQ